MRIVIQTTMSLKEKLRDIFDKYELEIDFLFIDFEERIINLYKPKQRKCVVGNVTRNP